MEAGGGAGAVSPPQPLLGAKLLPPRLGPFHLRRQRLLDRIAAGMEGRATFIVGGPGYGKTTLAAGFLQERPIASVWYSLDRSDRDPSTFFRYLTQGVKEQAPDFGERSAGLWDHLRGRPDEAERLADVFLREAEECLDGRLLIVLDAVEQVVGSDACGRALRRLLAYAPGALHLIVTGRLVPELGIRPLAAEGTVSVVQAEDLLFTPEETRSLLSESFGARAGEESIERIHARTHGWVTALQLLRQTARLEGGSDSLPEAIFARTETEIFDYFSEEVFASESEPVRAFLLGTAPPLRLDPEVSREVLPDLDTGGILADLVRRHLFISPLDSRDDLFAYAPLFHEFLRRKLRAVRGPEWARTLEVRYGRAFARRGQIVQALAHWTNAGEPGKTAHLLERHGVNLLRAGMLEVVRDAALFASRGGMRSAGIEDLLGETCRLAGDHAAAIGHFERALELFGAEDARRAGTLQGLSYSLLKMGETERAARTAREVLGAAGHEDPSLRSRILNTLALIGYREDRHQEALDAWQEALGLARQAEDQHLTLMIAHNMGLPHAAKGDFRRAADCFHMLTSADNPRLGPEEGAAYLNLARIGTLQGDHARAASLLGDAREIAHKWRLTGLSADVLEAEGNLLRATGDFDGARQKYAGARSLFTALGRLDLLDGLAEEEAVLAALRGDIEEAIRIASASVERQRAGGRTDALASALLALGEVRARSGDPRAAAAALEEAAEAFDALGRSYQLCAAQLWLSLARLRSGDRDEAGRRAGAALALAAHYDYREAVLRVARFDADFHHFLRGLPSAPSWLDRDLEEATGAAAVALGPISPRGADLTVRLFGPTEVYRDERRRIPAQAWKIRRALQVFCLLASSRDHRLTKDRIVDALWGEARPSVIEKNFHPTISFLRRALNHGHTVTKNFVTFERGAYQLSPAYRYDIDVEAFEDGVRKARRQASSGDVPAALASFDAALALYRGPYLEDEYEPWAENRRTHLASLLLAVLREAGELHLQAGDRETGLALVTRLVDEDPLDEGASCALMRTLGRLGNRGGVEKEFRRITQILAEELSSAPLPETVRIYKDALAAGTGRPAAGRTRR